MTISPELKAAFQFHIRTIAANRAGKKTAHWLKLQRDLDMREGGTAFRALNAARRDVAEGKRRYPSPVKPYAAVCWQPDQPIGNLPFPKYRKSGLAYVENPESVGLRLVGEVSIEFRRGAFNRNPAEGWLTDPFGDVCRDGTGLAWGEVYQLPGKDGESRFVAGYRFGGCDGGPTLELGKVYSQPRGDWELNPKECGAAIDAARDADSMAKSAAESEREYQTAWQAGSRWESESEILETTRAELKALLQERRKAKGAEGFPALCGAIKSQVSFLLTRIKHARKAMAKLAAGDDSDLHFWPGDDRLKDAFCEGAGLDKFPA